MGKSGFSLVELLVVMAIIGILAGLLFPTLGGIRKRARRTQTHNLVTQVDAAWHVHFNDFRSFPDPKYFEETSTDGDDISFPMTPVNLCILNWRTPRPNGFNGTTDKWMDGLVKAIKTAAGKNSANKPRNLTVDKGHTVATRDAYLELNQLQWIVGMVNVWGSRAAQKGFAENGVSGATSAIELYRKDHPDPRVWSKLDTGYNGKLDNPIDPDGFGVNKPAIAWVKSDSEKDDPIVSW